MRRSLLVVLAAAAALQVSLAGQRAPGRLNPVIALLEQHKPVFGLYAPSNGFPGQRNAPATPRPAADLVKDALGHAQTDFLFNGSMEGGLDRAMPSFLEFVGAMHQAGAAAKAPNFFLAHPLIVKAPKIAPELTTAVQNIGRELNAGVSGVMFVEAESADEVKAGLAAMRFKAHGGTRAEDVGQAPQYWGMSDAEYRKKADVWPLNPEGELVNWTIVESKEGLKHVREIAAVKGIGVLWPGAGTLRGVFTTTSPSGEKVFDEAGWEGAIQQVLAACKEFHVACGFPASATDIEKRMQQGFSVFVSGWGEPGFKAVELGMKAAGR